MNGDANGGAGTASEPQFGRLLERFDAFDPEFVENFWEVSGEMRERCPVAHSDAHGGFWVVSAFDDVSDGFADNDGLSTVPTTTIPPNPASIKWLPLQATPEMHRELRRFLNPFFRVPEVAKLEQGIRDSVNRIIDDFIERGSCEFINEFGRPLAGDVVFRQVLGLSDEAVAEAYRWTLAIVNGPTSSEAPIIFEKYTALVAGLLEERGAQPRREDVVDAVLHERVWDRPLTPDEARRTVMHLITAGLDTTAHALGNIMIRLADDPALRDRLEGDPSLIPGAVEEFVRIDPPAGGLVRTAVRDTVIGGQPIAAGERILLLVAGANRDPKAFEEPERLDVERTERNLSWGHGPHICLGMHLARLELKIALEELLVRVRDIALVDEHVEFENGTSRGPTALRITFTPASCAVS